MSTGALATTTAPRTYAELRRRVEDALLMAHRRVEDTKIQTYWETGRLIDQHLLVHKDRAQYGAEVIRRLGGDAGVSARVLYNCVQFARAYQILPARAKLTWAHYRVLAQIGDQSEREAIEAQAATSNWTSRELEERIWTDATADPTITPVHRAAGYGPKPLTPKRGVIGVYRIVPRPAPEGLTADNADHADTSRRLGFGTPIRGIRAIRGQLSSTGLSLALDLGFTSYLDLTADQARGLKDGDLVRLEPSGRIRPAQAAQPADLFAEQPPPGNRSRRAQRQLRLRGLVNRCSVTVALAPWRSHIGVFNTLPATPQRSLAVSPTNDE